MDQHCLLAALVRPRIAFCQHSAGAFERLHIDVRLLPDRIFGEPPPVVLLRRKQHTRIHASAVQLFVVRLAQFAQHVSAVAYQLDWRPEEICAGRRRYKFRRLRRLG